MVRQKEIQYSSRTRANTDQFKMIQRARFALANVLEKLPPELMDSEDVELLRSVADRKVYQIVQLIYRSRHYEAQSKDYDFSHLSMKEHWELGYTDAIRTLRHPEALARPSDRTGVGSFDLASTAASSGEQHNDKERDMNEAEVKKRAFAMPLTSPAYPPGPYRFVNREFMIITYRTDLEKLRALVPEPLQVDEPLVKYEFIRMPDFDRLRRLHRNRASHPRVIPRS